MGDSRQACGGRRAAACILSAMEEWLAGHPKTKQVLLVVYYLALIAALVFMYGRGDFSTPPFVYQEF